MVRGLRKGALQLVLDLLGRVPPASHLVAPFLDCPAQTLASPLDRSEGVT